MRAAAGTALALYVLCLVYFMFLHRRFPLPSRSSNLIPLRTVTLMIRLLIAGGRQTMHRIAVRNLAGNVAAFVPMGFLLPCVWRFLRRWWRTLGAGAAVVIMLEALQYLTSLGAADVDDLLLNLIGTALGYAAFATGTKQCRS